jgi:hypothetical protein
MRGYRFGLAGAFAIAIALQTASAAPSLPSGAALASSPTSVLVAHHHCGKGQRWVAAGYAKHGKYRPGHCAPA